jgi:hypothetical protein
MERSPYWDPDSCAATQRFMEPEGSLPYPQNRSRSGYPEQDQSSPHHRIILLQDLF